jgi:hypothetical protein
MIGDTSPFLFVLLMELKEFSWSKVSLRLACSYGIMRFFLF